MEWAGEVSKKNLKKKLVLRVATVCQEDELQSEKKMLKGVYVIWKNNFFFAKDEIFRSSQEHCLTALQRKWSTERKVGTW